MARRYFRTELLDEVGEEGNDSDRWVLSYADFITLMFAFFVVMYSVSSVNDGKFRVLSKTMLDVFQSPQIAAEVEQQLLEAAAERRAALDGDASLDLDAIAARAELRPDELGEVFMQLLQQPMENAAVRVNSSGDWTEVELAADAAFSGPAGTLAPDALAAIAAIADVARAVDMPVRVEGFTDNVPQAGGMGAGSWAVSAAQAASVAAALVAAGVDPERLSASAFAGRHPEASNASEAGRARNRRVVVAVARHDRVPGAAASQAARRDAPETVTPRRLERIDELPGLVGISF
ncbi:MAG: flagellar motor protein MotB [Gammaproteobacteria bacterium]